MQIQTIPKLSLSPYWSGTRPADLNSVQGMQDGACGVYAVLNALVLGGFVSRERLDKLWNTHANGTTKLGKWQQACGPLLLHGADHEDLSKLLSVMAHALKIKKSLHLFEVIKPGNKKTRGYRANHESLKLIKQQLESEKPLLLVLRGPKIAHWVVAVGSLKLERNREYKLAQILTVDSSEPIPGLHVWNGALGLGYQKDQYMRYMTISDKDGQACYIDGAWTLTYPDI
jgi:hypothetical protein